MLIDYYYKACAATWRYMRASEFRAYCSYDDMTQHARLLPLWQMREALKMMAMRMQDYHFIAESATENAVSAFGRASFS